MPTRREILEQLAAGEIDVSRATELLNEAAASDIPTPPDPPAAPLPPRAPEPPAPRKGGHRWLKIHVSDLETGRSRVRVNVPLGLVNLGLRLGSHFTDEVDSHMIEGVMEAIQDKELTGTLVEVEDEEDNERVHIFIE